ncbi:MAG: type II toxin-antitoxin system RelE/ParE family toxin [Planctomycetes bacterium]|nr:type II toxin-antitoxin system RelE/ParE family toxin [Planctomycetota bacterium]
MRRLIRSAQSEGDLVAIWRYIAQDNPTAATRLLERIDRRTRSLAKQPFMGERQPQFGENTRRVVEGNYSIFYDVLPDAIHVLRVFHGARKLDDLFG